MTHQMPTNFVMATGMHEVRATTAIFQATETEVQHTHTHTPTCHVPRGRGWVGRMTGSSKERGGGGAPREAGGWSRYPCQWPRSPRSPPSGPGQYCMSTQPPLHPPGSHKASFRFDVSWQQQKFCYQQMVLLSDLQQPKCSGSPAPSRPLLDPIECMRAVLHGDESIKGKAVPGEEPG